MTVRRFFRLAGIFVLINILFFAANLYWRFGSKARVTVGQGQIEAAAARAELEKKKVDQEAQLTVARNKANALLREIREEINTLELLRIECEALRGAMFALKTNDTGRAIALDPDLTLEAMRLYGRELRNLPSLDEIAGRQEDAHRNERQLLRILGTVFILDGKYLDLLKQDIAWANGSKDKADQLKLYLQMLERESTVKMAATEIKLDELPSLEESMERAAEAQARIELRAGLPVAALQKKPEAEPVAKSRHFDAAPPPGWTTNSVTQAAALPIPGTLVYINPTVQPTNATAHQKLGYFDFKPGTNWNSGSRKLYTSPVLGWPSSFVKTQSR